MFQKYKTFLMKNRLKLFLVLVFLVCACILLFNLKKINNIKSDINEIIRLADENQIKETTVQHISNMSENYQILPDKILYLSGKKNKGGNLFQTDRKGSDMKKLADDVTSFLEYEDKIYYITQSDSALYRYDPINNKEECLLEKGVEWFTVYETNILIIGGDSVKIYDLKKGTTNVLVEYLPLGYPFCAERVGDYIIICDSNVHLFSLKEKKDVLLLERWALSFDDITVYENKAYIKMQQYTIKNYDDVVLMDDGWNGVWRLDVELYEREKGNMGFEKLSEEQIEDLISSGEIPQSSNIVRGNQ